MFAHIFRKGFIINSSIPGEIKMNYPIANITMMNKLDEIFQFMYYYIDNHPTQITMFQLNNRIFNPVWMEWCRYMGMQYSMYEAMVNHANKYTSIVVKPYEPSFIDNYKPVPEKKFSTVAQSIPFSYEYIPYEFWYTSIMVEEYAEDLFYKLYEEYKKRTEDQYSFMRRTDIEELSFKDFLEDNSLNMGFNDEFSILLYNKLLEKELKNKHYLILPKEGE